MSTKVTWEAWGEAWEDTNVVGMPDMFAASGIANARWGFEAGWEARGLASRSEVAHLEEAARLLAMVPDTAFLALDGGGNWPAMCAWLEAERLRAASKGTP